MQMPGTRRKLSGGEDEVDEEGKGRSSATKASPAVAHR